MPFAFTIQQLYYSLNRNLYRKHLGDLYTESGQTLQCSFSSVSTPPIARVGAFIYKIFTPSHRYESKISAKTCCIFSAFLPICCKIFVKICSISTKFHQNFPRISQNLRECAPRTRPGEFPEFSLNFPRPPAVRPEGASVQHALL